MERLCSTYKITPSELFGGKRAPISGSLQERITKNIREAVKQSGLSYRDIAKTAGIDSSYIQLLVTGSRSPSLETILRLSHGLGKHPSELCA